MELLNKRFILCILQDNSLNQVTLSLHKQLQNKHVRLQNAMATQSRELNFLEGNLTNQITRDKCPKLVERLSTLQVSGVTRGICVLQTHLVMLITEVSNLGHIL